MRLHGTIPVAIYCVLILEWRSWCLLSYADTQGWLLRPCTTDVHLVLQYAMSLVPSAECSEVGILSMKAAMFWLCQLPALEDLYLDTMPQRCECTYSLTDEFVHC